MFAGLGCLPQTSRQPVDVLALPFGILNMAGNYRATDESAVNRAAELQRERENARIRETGMRLSREREAEARKPSRCIASATPTARKSEVTDRLDPAMISEAVADVKTQVMSCRDRSLVKGQVLVSVHVAAEGCVNAVTVVSTPESGLGICVATALQQATFAQTHSGGSFRYPFVF